MLKNVKKWICLGSIFRVTRLSAELGIFSTQLMNFRTLSLECSFSFDTCRLILFLIQKDAHVSSLLDDCQLHSRLQIITEYTDPATQKHFWVLFFRKIRIQKSSLSEFALFGYFLKVIGAPERPSVYLLSHANETSQVGSGVGATCTER